MKYSQCYLVTSLRLRPNWRKVLKRSEWSLWVFCWHYSVFSQFSSYSLLLQFYWYNIQVFRMITTGTYFRFVRLQFYIVKIFGDFFKSLCMLVSVVFPNIFREFFFSISFYFCWSFLQAEDEQQPTSSSSVSTDHYFAKYLTNQKVSVFSQWEWAFMYECPIFFCAFHN